jgi:uncharacterized LabA/DUF88 family protein
MSINLPQCSLWTLGIFIFMSRVAIFIDGGYLEKLLINQFAGARVDFAKLAATLADSRDILRTYYYHCPPYQSSTPTPEESKRYSQREKFFYSIGQLPRFHVRLGQLAYRGMDALGKPIFQQKRVDIMLGVDLVQLSATKQINTAILLAGDSDFVPAIEVAKQHGVLVELWHGPRKGSGTTTVHNELWSECDERKEITVKHIDAWK